MKTCDTIAGALSAPRTDCAAGARGSLQGSARADDASEVTFTCPVCASSLRVARRLGEVAGLCPVCGAGVVAPQPEFGCRAMPYRDWLRLQEIDWPETPPKTAGPATAGAPVAKTPVRLRRASRKAVVWTAAVGVVALLGFAGLASWHRPAGAAPEGAQPLQGAPVATTLISAPAASDDRAAAVPVVSVEALEAGASPIAANRPPTRSLSPLAALLDGRMPEGGFLTVEAARTHDFARSAPPAEAFVCLKLADPADATVTARAYVPVASEAAAAADALLPWGRRHRVAIILRWQEADTADGVTGHWRVVSLQDAAPALTSAR